jgi:hypothetical protein
MIAIPSLLLSNLSNVFNKILSWISSPGVILIAIISLIGRYLGLPVIEVTGNFVIILSGGIFYFLLAFLWVLRKNLESK